MFEVQGCNPEELSSPLAVTGGYNWGMDIKKPPFMEELMNGHTQGMADPENGSKGIGP
jgi:hypothetical protein